jgi:hypothetical protein
MARELYHRLYKFLVRRLLQKRLPPVPLALDLFLDFNWRPGLGEVKKSSPPASVGRMHQEISLKSTMTRIPLILQILVGFRPDWSGYYPRGWSRIRFDSA